MKRWEFFNQVFGENKSAEKQAQEMLEVFVANDGRTNDSTKRLNSYREWLEEERC